MRWPSHLAAIFFLCLASSPAQAVSVMVNEFYNGSAGVGPGTKMARDEYIEFVITGTTTAAELASLTFGDANDNTSQLQSVFQFDLATLEGVLSNSGVSAFQAGTIIVVKGIGLGSENLTYNPTALNLTDTDAWSIELVAGQGARDHSETRINGNMGFGNNGEVVWISSDVPPVNNTDTSGFVHAIGYDNSPGIIGQRVTQMFGSENMLTTTVTSGRAVSNNGGATESLVTSTTGTMGQANSLANTLWIVGGLRTTAALGIVPEPDRVSLLLVAAALMLLRRSRRGGEHA